jgi:hypothetical protein
MQSEGFITPAQARAANAEPVLVAGTQSSLTCATPA